MNVYQFIEYCYNRLAIYISVKVIAFIDCLVTELGFFEHLGSVVGRIFCCLFKLNYIKMCLKLTSHYMYDTTMRPVMMILF